MARKDSEKAGARSALYLCAREAGNSWREATVAQGKRGAARRRGEVRNARERDCARPRVVRDGWLKRSKTNLPVGQGTGWGGFAWLPMVIFAATTAASQADSSTWMRDHPWVGVFFGVAATGVLATKATARPLVNATNVGTGTPVVSAAENAASLVMSLVAVFLPVLVVVVLLMLDWAAYSLVRRSRDTSGVQQAVGQGRGRGVMATPLEKGWRQNLLSRRYRQNLLMQGWLKIHSRKGRGFFKLFQDKCILSKKRPTL